MSHFPPIRTAARHSCRKAVLWLAFAAALPAGAALANPNPEYGPEVEARFLQRCEDSRAGMGPEDCLRLSERLQHALGYEAYLAHADRGPEAFTRLAATRCILATALRRAEPGCATRAAAATTR
jgi:hypothetical protein